MTAAVSISVPALASHTAPQKTSNTRSDTQHHYSHYKHFFSRHGDHANHNPHHRNCGTVPGGGCCGITRRRGTCPPSLLHDCAYPIFNCHINITNKKMLV